MSGSLSWSGLTPDQQGQVLAWIPLFRSGIVQLVKTIQSGTALDNTWKTAISAVLADLTAGTIIPDSTGLAGAVKLTNTDVQNMMTLIETLLASANTSALNAEYLKAVGPANF